MEKHSFILLVKKYVNGQATEEEKLVINDYLEKLEAGGTELSEEEELLLKQTMFSNIKHANKAKRIVLHRKQWIGYAAAVLLLFCTCIFLWMATRKNDSSLTNNTSLSQTDIAPGGNKAVLTLSDGSTIILDNASTGILAKQGSTQVVKLESGQIAYQLKGSTGETPMMNRMETPKGGQYQLTLPDGSRVWLNAASSITYPVAFVGAKRNVRITGEVYFEVAKNKEKPFIVDVDGKSTVQVLGTHFNINSYEDEGSIRTTLLEGSVAVSQQQSLYPASKAHLHSGPGAGPDTVAAGSVILIPGQQASIPAASRALSASPTDQPGKRPKVTNRIIVSTPANLEEIVAWKDGYFQFNDAELGTVLRQLGRWYDVNIAYEGTIPAKKFIGEIPRDATLSQVLKVLERTGVDFRIDGKKIIVISKK